MARTLAQPPTPSRGDSAIGGTDATMPRHSHRFVIGSFRCLVLDDGAYEYDAAPFFTSAPPGELDRALERHGVLGGRITTPYACLLVDTGRALVLVDTGGAGWDPGVGRLQASLLEIGVDPLAVDVVILTHGHPDHIGGTSEHGRPVFGNARHVMDDREWSFWTRPATLRRVPERYQEIATANLPPISARLGLTHGECEVVSGIRVLPSPGHTPGHVAVIVSDQGEELVYISDAALHPIHLEHPDWRPRYDMDPAQAVQSRRMLLDRAARGRSLVHAYHFGPFPCLGHVEAIDDGWRWDPLRGPAGAPDRPIDR